MTPFIAKLRHGARLTAADETFLAELAGPARPAPRGDIVPEGAVPHTVPLLLEGWACRFKQLENGRRQITDLYLPGDLCQPFGALPSVLDHTLSALTPVRLARVTPRSLRDACHANPRIEAALWWDLLVADGIAREHLVSLGRRMATERLGHFFCEVHVRLAMAGLAERPTYELPLIQADLADLFGLSSVHVNRSLQELRNSGFLSLHERHVTIHDVQALRELSMFDPAYLAPGDRALAPFAQGAWR